MKQALEDWQNFLRASQPLLPARWHIVKCNARRRLYQRARPNVKDLPPELFIEMPDLCPNTQLILNYNPLENLGYDAPAWGQINSSGDWGVISRVSKITNTDEYEAIYGALITLTRIYGRYRKPTRAEVIEALGKPRAILVKSQHYLAGLT